MNKRANEPAYPASGRHVGGGAIEYFTMGGMTLREHYAGLAMQALLAGGANLNADQIAEWAGIHADALIARLSKEPTK